MNRIDRLILQARKAVAPGLELGPVMIEKDGDSWTAVVQLYNGKSGHGPDIRRSTWHTLERALEHVQAVADEYPNSRDVPIIIDDLG